MKNHEPAVGGLSLIELEMNRRCLLHQQVARMRMERRTSATVGTVVPGVGRPLLAFVGAGATPVGPETFHTRERVDSPWSPCTE